MEASMQARQGADAAIEMPEIISALSFALDLTEGADPGHAVRTTLLGMRIAMALGFPQETLAPLYYALQLKDVGCSSNAARVAHLFGGDDRSAKALTRLTDWTGLFHPRPSAAGLRLRAAHLVTDLRLVPQQARTLWSIVLPEAGIVAKVRRFSALRAGTAANTRDLIHLRCDRGATILRKLRVSDLACESVRHLDERWDGSGYPDGLERHGIPVLARISAVAQSLDVFASAHGIDHSMRVLQRRSGCWYDPEIVQAAVALHKANQLWQACQPGCPVERTRDVAVSLSPYSPAALDPEEIDAICEAFADVVDAKSPFTFRHSINVTETAVALAEELGLPARQRKLLQRAALLHDLGKLGVPNSILDKNGALTAAERQTVLQHPGMSHTILSRIPAFVDIAHVAGEHHERLDGSGYPHGLSGKQLRLESRLLAMADCFAALAEQRPYRVALPLHEVLAVLRRDVPAKLDPQVFEALEAVVRRWGGTLPETFYPATNACTIHPRAARALSPV